MMCPKLGQIIWNFYWKKKQLKSSLNLKKFAKEQKRMYVGNIGEVSEL